MNILNERTNERGGTNEKKKKRQRKERRKKRKNHLATRTHIRMLIYQTTTPLDHPTPSSIENQKRVLRLPTKDIISTKNRLISVQLLMVCVLSLYRLHCCLLPLPPPPPVPPVAVAVAVVVFHRPLVVVAQRQTD